MVSHGSPRAWLLMAVGSDRGHGGNAGYDDQVDAYYSWDSKVPNHKGIKVGDVVALWDKTRLLGVSVVEEIEVSDGFKTQYRCVRCRATRIQARKTALPRYRCSKCRSEFDEPDAESVPVKLYTARHDAAWTPLDGLLSAEELRPLNAHQGDINAMRPLNWPAFSAALAGKGADRAVERVGGRAPDLVWGPQAETRVELTHGFTHSVVRVRRGQRKFREHLLASQGGLCAFTGAAPERVLDAGHLYSYAQLGTHHEHGGLMLRRDIHRLFDDGLLAVEPSRLRVDVADELARFPQYARLHGSALVVPLRDTQVGWLSKHWDEHRRSVASV
jgi:DNA-directed RNA polymerase subunit RPC12/RpoP